ncbi:LysR substrate-binding domain-containing protein [Thiomonas sp.]|jgi:DNA-binding transcriptional LysR family regulator|uniref:LysR substrate-binding domain-containing protein n=1 Tax=Thiomonas sp. TaxID=2047785 RepID=UPI002615BCEB|nr:LysR substrate-binding domain-containing protein [Thiomonas sp.]
MNDLNDLAAFAAVAEHGGYAAAERALGAPRSRLSRRVAALERQLGVRLIHRTSRRFALTETGQAVLRHAQAMLAEAQAAHAVAAPQQQPRGTVRLSCPPALLHHAVDAMIARLLNAWPELTLHIEATNRNVDVWQDGVDLALRVRAADAPLPAEEVVRTLAISPHVLVAAPALLANAAPPARPADLQRLPSLGLGNSREESAWTLHGPSDAVERVPHRPRLIVDDMDALLRAALAGVGVAAVPLLAAHELLQTGALQRVLPDWAPPAGRIQAALPSRQALRPAARLVLDTLARDFAELAAQGKCLRA